MRPPVAAAAGSYLLLVAVNTWYFYPILTGQIITRNAWLTRLWFPSWL